MKNKFFSRALAVVLSIVILAVGLPLAGLTVTAADADTEYVIWEADPTRITKEVGSKILGADDTFASYLGYDEALGEYYSYAKIGWASDDCRIPIAGVDNNTYRALVGQVDSTLPGVTTALNDSVSVMTALNTAKNSGKSVYFSADIMTGITGATQTDAQGVTVKMSNDVNWDQSKETLFTITGEQLKSAEGKWVTVSGLMTMPTGNWWQGYLYFSGQGIVSGLAVKNIKFTVKEEDRDSINTALTNANTGWTFDNLVAFDKVANYSTNVVDPNAPAEYAIWEADPTRITTEVGSKILGDDDTFASKLGYDEALGEYYSYAKIGWASDNCRIPIAGVNNNTYRALVGQVDSTLPGAETALNDSVSVMTALNTAKNNGQSVYFSADIMTGIVDGKTQDSDQTVKVRMSNDVGDFNTDKQVLFEISANQLKSAEDKWVHVSGLMTMPTSNWWQGYLYFSGQGIVSGLAVKNIKFTVKEEDRDSINTALTNASTGWTFDNLIAFDRVANYSVNKIKINTVADNGTITLNNTKVFAGDSVTFSVEAASAHSLTNVTVVNAENKAVEFTDNGNGTYTFTAPRSDVTITATFERMAEVLAVTSTKSGEGTVELSSGTADPGATVTFKAAGAHGYKTANVSVTDAEGTPVEYTKNGVSYSFVMPQSDVNVAVTFEEITDEEIKYVIWEADPDRVSEDEGTVVSYSKSELPTEYSDLQTYTNYETYRYSGDDDGDPSYYSTVLKGNGDNANTVIKSGLSKNTPGLEWIEDKTVLDAFEQYMTASLETKTSSSTSTYVFVKFANGYHTVGDVVSSFTSDTAGGNWVEHTKKGLDFTEWWNGSVNFSHWLEGNLDSNGLTLEIRKMKIELSSYDEELINYALSGTDYTFASVTAFDKQSTYTNNKYSSVTTEFKGVKEADVEYSGVSSDGKAVSGSTVHLTVPEKTGFTLVSVAVKDANGETVNIVKANGAYSFTMPASAVTVKITYTNKGTGVYDEYTIWEADPTRGKPNAEVGEKISNDGFDTKLGEENGEFFYSSTSGTDSWAWSYVSTGLNSNSYSIPWIGSNAVLKAIGKYMTLTCDVRGDVSGTKVYIQCNTGAESHYYEDVKVKLIDGYAVGTAWQTIERVLDFSAIAESWYGGNIMIQAWNPNAAPTVDIRNLRITVKESDRAAINAALEGTGYTFDDIIAFDPSSNYGGNYLEYNRIKLSQGKLNATDVSYTNTVGIQSEKKAKPGDTVTVAVGETRRQTLAGIKVTCADGTDIKTNGLSFVMPDQAVTVQTYATDDISHRTTVAVDTGNNTQQINFIATFKHTLKHIVAGYDIKATYANGEPREYHIYGTDVYEALDGKTALSVSGNNDGYAFVAGISGVPTNIGAIEFEVTPFVYDTYKNGIVKGETEVVYYDGGKEDTDMIKRTVGTKGSAKLSFETDHPGVVGMSATYTLSATGVTIVNASDFTEQPTISGKTLTVPYSVRNSNNVLKLKYNNEEFWVAFEKFTNDATFSDDFDTLDETKWSAYGSDSISKVEVSDGKLVMKSDAEGSASSLTTTGKFSQSYGSFSATIKVPKAGNGNAAFWLYSIPNKSGIVSDDGTTVPVEPYVPNLNDPKSNSDVWNSSGEIDVIEHSAKWDNNKYATSLHWNGYDKDGASTSTASAQENCGINIADGNYHTFSTVWTETSITWYVDGMLIFQYTPGNTMDPNDCANLRDDGMGVGPDSGEMMLILQNLVDTKATSSSWVGAYNANDFANGAGYMYVDSVSVYGLQ